MTNDFFLNLMSVAFPVLCLILTLVPNDVNDFINTTARWIYRRFNVAESRRNEFHLNPVALRVFGIIGLLFTMAMITLMFYRPAA